MISKKAMNELHQAYEILEHPGFRIKAMNVIGKPIEKVVDWAPDSIEQKISKVCNFSIKKMAEIALFTLKKDGKPTSSNWSDKLHRVSTWATGAAGGLFGLPGTLVEIPVTTTIILRSIFDIAKSEGENIRDVDVKLAVLQVFALGGESKSDDLADTAYYTIRTGMALEINAASQFLKNSGKLVDPSAPQIIKVIQKIAARFSIPVTEKAVAQAMPFISAGIGIILNDTFITHFQDMAHAHFTVRRLERKYGADEIKQAYESFNEQK